MPERPDPIEAADVHERTAAPDYSHLKPRPAVQHTAHSMPMHPSEMMRQIARDIPMAGTAEGSVSLPPQAQRNWSGSDPLPMAAVAPPAEGPSFELPEHRPTNPVFWPISPQPQSATMPLQQGSYQPLPPRPAPAQSGVDARAFVAWLAGRFGGSQMQQLVQEFRATQYFT